LLPLKFGSGFADAIKSAALDQQVKFRRGQLDGLALVDLLRQLAHQVGRVDCHAAIAD
jgi:hypothetical protein